MMTMDNHNLIQHPALCAKYTVEKKLGQGTQGQMYLVRRASGERFAVKAYNLKTIPNWKANDLMVREIEVLQKLDVDRVPRCVDVIDASTSEIPYIFIVQEYVDGDSLLEMINNGHRFSITDIIRITKDIATILDDIGHTAKIIHRDIKPSNIMIDHKGRAWLVDFGSVVRNPKHEGGSTLAGTAGYMSPEQCIGDALPVSDIFALGMSLIHLLTGIEPYKMDLEHLRPNFRPHLPRHIPAWFVDLINRMIDPSAATRITAEQILPILDHGNPDDISWFDLEKKHRFYLKMKRRSAPEKKWQTKATNDVRDIQNIRKKTSLLMNIHPEAMFLFTSQISIIILMLIITQNIQDFVCLLFFYLFLMGSPYKFISTLK